ncbi:MAG: tRNA cyclic N6-threonylcarbamoyladenosine(37) synthase TcdA [Rhodocyclaceae bacterium]|nr:MAG: tRNA cyclic N6-threonylcarbamoyladenosine(37) synthase TcdA [Rhodocyclaceae bacterium]
MNDSPDYERRFGGMARLYGSQALVRLQDAHVCVIGVGGVGSWAVEALARSGVGRLTLIDLDHVAESNMNRQLHAVEDNLGKAKVQAMAERIAAINPACVVTQVDDFIAPDNIAALIPACDAVIDAIDQVRAKAALAAHCRRQKLWLVTTGGAGGRIDPTRVKVEDLSRTTQDALASKVRASLRKDYGFPRDPKKKFGLPCVYSDEQIIRPQEGAACDTDAAGSHPVGHAAPQGLNCAGYGSSVAVTASFGFAAAAQALNRILGR